MSYERFSGSDAQSGRAGGRGQGNRNVMRQPEQLIRPELPMLQYGSNNNIMVFKTKLIGRAKEKYGDLANFIQTGEYMVPEPVSAAGYDLDNDEHGLQLDALKTDNRERAKKISAMRYDRTPLYAFIIRHISHESLDAIKLVEGYDTWCSGNDPLQLWKAIEATHSVASSSRVPGVLKANARQSYQRAGQHAFETIVSYKERFDALLETYKGHDNPQLDAPDIAMDFFGGLDNARYHDFKVGVINDLSKGTMKPVETLNAMYMLAAGFLVSKNMGRRTPNAAFVTIADSRSRREDSNGRGGRGGRTGRAGRQGRGGRGRGGRSAPNAGTANSDDAAQQDRHNSVVCWGCEQIGHILANCPNVGRAVATVNERSAHVTYKVMCAGGAHRWAWFEVLLDNQADTGLIHPRLLRNIRKIAEPVHVTGATGDTADFTMVGDLDHFGEMLTTPDWTVNVLSFAQVSDRYDITYDVAVGFTVHLPDREPLVFRRQGGLYVGDMRAWGKGCAASSYVTTVQQNELHHSTAEVLRARAARDIAQRLTRRLTVIILGTLRNTAKRALMADRSG